MKNVPVRSFIRTVLSLLMGVALISLITPDNLAARSGKDGKPKSIILFIADGMGIGQHTLAYYFTDNYPYGRFEAVGLMTTHPVRRDRVTDSASGATALATGHKNRRKVLSQDERGRPLRTVIEIARDMDMGIGIVSTASVTDATPAAFVVHHPSRYDHLEIAQKMVRAGLDVLLGAGYHYFAGRDRGGRQKVDLLLQQAASGTQIITSITDKVSPDRPVIGLFGNEEMKDIPGRDPTLLQMAQMAVQHLSARESGYFLLIEEEMTDSHSHDNLHKEAREAIIEVGGTVNFLLDYQAEHPDVLLVFTADHETGGYIIEEKGEQPGKPKWTTGNHTGNMIPIFASGPGSAAFDGLLDNTDVGKLLIKYLQ